MKERQLDNILKKFYQEDYEEDGRLTRDKMHQLEFITTTKYIDKYLKKGDRILEVGAGTGKYSLHYADKGYQVDAIELVEANIKVLKSNIKNNMNIKVEQGNALDLTRYKDNTFDITLLLGPLYHLFDKEEQEKAIKEAIRVTKKGGIIYIAFILFDVEMLNSAFIKGTIKQDYLEEKRITKEYKPINTKENIFNLMYIKDVKQLIEKQKAKNIHYVSTDGASKLLRDTINNMDEETYKHYINYHFSICEREDLIGYSCHILSIIIKE